MIPRMNDGAEDTEEVTTELVAIPVSEEITLDGILWTPPAASSDTAIALFHGTGAAFYYPLLTWLGRRLAAMGYPTLSLNRRDHSQFFGYYPLAEASMDHAHAIDLLGARGAARVVLVGHSYGTVTAPWYVARTDDPRVPALVLLSALGDLRLGSLRMAGGQEPYDALVEEARQRVASGDGEGVFVNAPMVPGDKPLPHRWSIFLDKRGPESEAVPAELLRHVGDRPLLAVRDPADPFPATTPPAREMLEAANPRLDYVLLDDIRGGATDESAHRFAGREEEVFTLMTRWLAGKGLAP